MLAWCVIEKNYASDVATQTLTFVYGALYIYIAQRSEKGLEELKQITRN